MKIEYAAPLRDRNSLGVDSTADELVVVTREEDIPHALDFSGPITILGEGTNVVLRRHIPGRVVCPQIGGIEIAEVGSGRYRVRAGAGVNWHELVRHTLGRGIRGLENLALIPGSVGAAPFQNVGAYGRELSSLLSEVEVWDREEHRWKTLRCDECGFDYRNSVFRSGKYGRYVISRVVLELGQQHLDTSYAGVSACLSERGRTNIDATEVAEAVIHIRRKKLPDPRVIGNVGSFFKNPVLSPTEFNSLQELLEVPRFETDSGIKIPAAALVDAAGWKGRRIGTVGVWHLQPIVLVNLGHASGEDVLDLARRISDDIHCRYGVVLELEPLILGTG